MWPWRKTTEEQIRHDAKRIPEFADFLCPLTGVLMKDPVTAKDGFNYDRAAIERWLQSHETSPTTHEKIGKDLKSNEALKKVMLELGRHYEEERSEGFELVWPAHGNMTGQRSIEVPPRPQQPVPEPPSKRPNVQEAASTCQDMSKSFRELDRNRDLLHSVLDGWKPPRIVAVGDEA